MSPVISLDLRTWAEKLDKPMTHKECATFLRRMQHTVRDATKVVAFAQFSMTGKIDSVSGIAESAVETTFSYKADARDSIATLPKSIPVRAKLLVDGEGRWTEHDFDVLVFVDLPSEPGKPPMFTLTCPGFAENLNEAVRDGLSFAISDLEPHATVLLGSVGYGDIGTVD